MWASGQMLDEEARKAAEDSAKGVRRFISLAALKKREQRKKAKK